MPKQYVNPAGVVPMNYHYAVRAGSLIFMAGNLPLDAAGAVVGTTPGAQAEQCLDNLELVLKAAGGALRDVVFVRLFVTHFAHREPAKAVIQARFGEKRPPSTTIVVVSLGFPESMVEIEATAVVGD